MEICKDHFSDKCSFHPEDLPDGVRTDEEFQSFLPGSAQEKRCRIICAYFKVLDKMGGSVAVDRELPFSRKQIERAILEELSEDPDCDLRRKLEIAYVLLESFVPYDEYRVIEDFKKASLCAQQIADMGDPTSILRSARIVKKARGDSAVMLQEKIYQRMRERQTQLMELGRGSAA